LLYEIRLDWADRGLLSDRWSRNKNCSGVNGRSAFSQLISENLTRGIAMGGYGSGRGGGRPTVESALRLDIDAMIRWGVICPGAHLGGEMRFDFYDDRLDIKFVARVGDPWRSCLRLQYSIADYWTGEELQINDRIYLATSRPHFGGSRWWFVCPRTDRRVRKLYLPLGGRHFW
jgi:hypothetical protein